jgi:dihydrofolate synthase/folylpolyglutamate synthase
VNFRSAVRELDGRQPESMPGPSLDRIAQLVTLLDHPELTYPTLHITGTNGKTTTSLLATDIACELGVTTGTFTSPHLASVRERIALCGDRIGEEDFAEAWEHIRPYLDIVDAAGDGGPVTYFEALTALAFLWFADKPVGLGVFEVGMGGSWDATNLIRGDVAILCPIGLDHRELGSTVAEVASEKAGIVKEGRTAVVREQRPEAMAVIERRAADVGATLLVEGQEFALAERASAVGGQALAIEGARGSYDALFVPLFGEAAARNAAAAVAACEALFDRPLDQGAVRAALATAISPGRVEVVARRPLVILDGAHNPDAAEALVATLYEAFRWGQLHLVMGAFRDKDVEAVAGIFARLADRAYACSNSSPRSAAASRVAEALADGGLALVEEHPSVDDALTAALGSAQADDLVLVTGSFYTVADARPRFAGA